MAGIDDILKALPIDQIASKLGVDRDTAQKAVKEGGATILTGLEKNAQSPAGSAAIEKALGKHRSDADDVDIDRVDTADGEKILGHIFGGQEKEVAQKLTSEPQTAGIDFGKLLPMLAPIVMGMLAKKQGGADSSGSDRAAEQGSGGIGDVIGGLLGGGSGGSGAAPGGLDIGGLLGGLLGGKK